MCNCTSEVWSFGPSRNDGCVILPITAETTVAVVIAAAAAAAIGNSEHAVDGAHRATDAGANGAANHTAHGAGDPAAFVGTLLRPAHNTLGMTDMGNHEECEHDRRSRKMQFYGPSARQRRCSDLSLHRNFLLLGRDCADIAWEAVTRMRPKSCALVMNSGRAGPGGGSRKRGCADKTPPPPCLRPWSR